MDRICLIVDFDGFQLKGQRFLTREAAFVAMESDHCGVVSFDLSSISLDHKDVHTVWWCQHFLHGLPFNPRKDEDAKPIEYLDQYILDLYRRFSTPTKNLIAYKGGNCERVKLQQLNLPHVNLEKFGCPKYDHLLNEWEDCHHPCNLHDRSIHKVYHCALSEVKIFKLWVLDQIDRENQREKRRQRLENDEGWKLVKRSKRILQQKVLNEALKVTRKTSPKEFEHRLENDETIEVFTSSSGRVMVKV